MLDRACRKSLATVRLRTAFTAAFTTTGGAIALWQSRLVRPESRRAARLAAVSDHDGEVRKSDGASRRNDGQPAPVINEQQHRHHEAHQSQPLHQQIPALALADLGRSGQRGLGDQIGLVTMGIVTTSTHSLTLGPIR